MAGAITLDALLKLATPRLAGTEHESPRHEALRIWGGAFRESLGDVILDRDRIIAPAAAEAYLALVDRRAAGEPMAYVIGSTGFRHLDLKCDARALIPRPETEGVVEDALGVVRRGIAADVGTGTGAIALSLKKEGAFDQVIGIDISPGALSLARENGEAAGLEVDWRLGDLVAPLRAPGEQVNLLVSNPPYLTEAEFGDLDGSVRDFEPRLALVAGQDGMTVITRLCDEAREVVAADGWMVLEIDARRASEAMHVAMHFGWQDVHVQDDLFGRARCLLARRGSME